MKKQSFAQIETLPLPDRVAFLIEEAIMRGEISPGTKLKTYDLARQFNVSSIPVREALKKLEMLGFVVMEVNRSARVVDLNQEDFEQIQAVRIPLEQLAISLAAARMNATARKNLRETVAMMRRAAKSKNFITLVDADKRFHEILWDLTENPHLIKTLRGLLLPYFGFLVSRATYAHIKDLEKVPRTHEELMNALFAGDIADAQKILMGMHSRLSAWFSSLKK